MINNIYVTIDSMYHRCQFDDWLAGGKIEIKQKTYYWSAQNNNYGFGWEIEPVTEEDWDDVPDDESNEIMSAIQKCILKHTSRYRFKATS